MKLIRHLFRHVYMIAAEVVTLFLYMVSMAFLPEYFGEFLLPEIPDGALLTETAGRPLLCHNNPFCLESGLDCCHQLVPSLPHQVCPQ